MNGGFADTTGMPRSARYLVLVGALVALVNAAFAAPPITSQPAPPTQSVNVGENVAYSVAATGTGTLSYQWMKRTTGPYANIVSATNATLTLTNVQAADAATYRVTVTDDTGSTNSKLVSLTVNGPPVITPTTTLQHQAITLGAAATFTVTATGSETLTYQWQKNGVDMVGQTNASLTFAAVAVADEADYSVTVSNAFGTVTSEPARLWVVPPTSQYVSANFTNSAGFRLPYFYILPPGYNPARKYPLWVYFHGASDTESTFLTGSGAAGFSRVCVSYARQLADPIIAVYVTRQTGSASWNGYAPVVAELIPWLQANFSVDASRIYIAGQSVGGKPAVDVVTMAPANYAGLMICNGTGDTEAVAAISGVPLWAVWSQGDTVVTGTPAWVQAFRRAGGRAVFTQFVTPSHANSIMMGFTLPAAVEWLFAQKLRAASTHEPRISITTPTTDSVYRTTATNVNLAGTVAALGETISGVTWENTTTGTTGNATATNAWSTGNIPLAADRSSRLLVTATIGTSWAPAYGGSTSFDNGLLVTVPFDATLIPQSPGSLLLNWSGGYAPYRIQSSPDLTTWTDVNTNATPPMSVTATGPRGFYRVVGQ